MNTKTDAQRNAEAKARHIEGLIAALGMDFDRLDELRESLKADPEAFEDQEELNDLEAIVTAAELDPSQCTEDGLIDAIHELPLEVSLRSGWHTLGEEMEAVEVRVLLTFGGPSCEIRADWDANRGCSSPQILWAEMGARGELFDFDHDAVKVFVDYLCGV